MASEPAIRRAVLWRWRPGVGSEQRLAAKEGLAYLAYSSPVDAVDFGEDLGLADGNHDLALVRDHADRASWQAYDADHHHARVGAFIDSLTEEEQTARADYLCHEPGASRGSVRHLALISWRVDLGAAERDEVRAALRGLRARCGSLAGLELADDLGWAGAGRADLVLEARFADVEAAAACLAAPAFREVEALVGAATDARRGGRIEHRVGSG